MSINLGSNNLTGLYLGNTAVSGAFLGLNQIWPQGPAPMGFYVSGALLTSGSIASKLTGETTVFTYTGSVFTSYTSSTIYNIANFAFNNTNVPDIKEFIDNGATAIGQLSFGDQRLMVSASFSKVQIVNLQAFQVSGGPLSKLSYIYLPSLSGSTALGGSPGLNFVFDGISYTGSITVPSYYSSSNGGQPDGDLQYLTTSPRSWTINYI